MTKKANKQIDEHSRIAKDVAEKEVYARTLTPPSPELTKTNESERDKQNEKGGRGRRTCLEE